MNDESLFGTEVEANSFHELAGTRLETEDSTQNAMTPTIILSIMFCPALTGLSYAYRC